MRKRQEELERTQKEEEDAMFKKFEEERRAAANEAEKETEEEWEVKLKDIIAMFESKKIDQDEFERVCGRLYSKTIRVNCIRYVID